MAHLLSGLRERRAYPRVNAVYEARVRLSQEGPVRGQLVDLSRSGAFIRLFPAAVLESRVIELVLVTPRTNRVIRLWRRAAVVVRRSPAGVGVAFLRPSWRHRRSHTPQHPPRPVRGLFVQTRSHPPDNSCQWPA